MLPAIASEDEWKRLAPDTAAFLPGAARLAARHGARGELARTRDGSMLVFTVGDEAVLKLFPAPFRRWCAREKAFLARVHGRLGVPTPELLADGEDGGWSYVLMRRLHGTPMDRAAPPACFDQLGELVARLAEVPVDGLPAEDWDAFLTARIAGCVDEQRGRGLAEAWLAQLPGFLAAHAPRIHRVGVAHTELGPGHVLVDGERITGLIDFADAVVGDPDFEWPAIGLFLCGGDRPRYRRVVRAAGRAVPPERVMACALLHPYSNLTWYLREVPPPAGVDRLDALAEVWFGHA